MDADDVYNQGVELHRSGHKHAALACFERAVSMRPDHLPALANRGTVLADLDRPGPALDSFDAALEWAPGHPILLNGRAHALLALTRFDEAAHAFEAYLAVRPDDAGAHSNLGAALEGADQLDAALAAINRALALDPAYGEAAYNRGNVLRELGRFAEALAAYDRAIALGDPDGSAAINKALVLLLTGDFAAGLPLYEERWRSAQAGEGRALDRALWGHPAALAGKRVRLEAEQGLGDTLQMLRYAAPLADLGATVSVQVPATLEALASTAPGVAAVNGQEADAAIPMMALPLLFGMDAVPAPPAYLSPRAQGVAAWKTRLGPARRPRIGLAWRGNPHHQNDRRRSLPFSALRPLLALDAEFISLHAEHRADETDARLTDVSDGLHTLADTAALIANVDLVIAVDTSVAHLAGALGKPVRILLPAVPDFRWGVSGETTPWYPSARLIRQPTRGDWASVIDQAASAP
jgi:tetratricopeptide (TPR) repeat protein